MIYRAIGMMSGSSLDGMDIVYVEFEESGGKWSYNIVAAECMSYDDSWLQRLRGADKLDAYEYMLLHTAYGRLIGEKINEFIEHNELHHKVQVIASHGHTVFHAPQQGMTAQLGDGAAIAAITGINTVTDLRAMDVALGGQGAPIVPMGEKILLAGYDYYLNLGGITNISGSLNGDYIAFDVCPANRVLNMLAETEGKVYDDGGAIASAGSINTSLLTELNNEDYYKQPYPKSLANNFGTDVLYPLILSHHLSAADALRTYTEHIVQQVVYAINNSKLQTINHKLLVTGGGTFNNFLIERLKNALAAFNIEVVVPDEKLVKFKEALIMALLGILRWREEYTVMHSVTGASRSSIGGAVWMGQEA